MIFQNKTSHILLTFLAYICFSPASHVSQASDVISDENMPVIMAPTLDMHAGQFSEGEPSAYLPLCMNGIKLKKANECHKALPYFFKAAQFGVESAMYHMADIYENKGDIEIALKWYMISFQKVWLQDPQKAHKSLAKHSLLRLLPEHINVLLIYPEDILETHEKIYRLITIIDFYKVKSAEPYLTCPENDAKIQWLSTEKKRLIEQNMLIKLKKERPFLNMDRLLIDPKSIEKEEKDFTDSLAHAKIYINYRQGCGFLLNANESQANYLKAYTNYMKSASVASLYDVGIMYMNGFLDDKPDYSKAELCFKLAGDQKALHMLGILYMNGYIGDVFNRHTLAKKYFKEATLLSSYMAIAMLYLTEEYENQPDNGKIKKYLKKALTIKAENTSEEQDQLYACLLLGNIYAAADGLTKENTFYKPAITYLKRAMKAESIKVKKEAYTDLNILYMRRKNYDEVIKNFTVLKCNNYDYIMGVLHEMGLFGKKSNKKSTKPSVNYQKAFNHYLTSENYNALINAARIWRINLKSTEEFTDVLTEKITVISANLQGYDKIYFDGMMAFYFYDTLEKALTSLKEACKLKFSEDLNLIIGRIENYLAQSISVDEKTKVYNVLAFDTFEKRSKKRKQSMKPKVLREPLFTKTQGTSEKHKPIVHVNVHEPGFDRWLNTIKDQGTLKKINEGLQKLETGERYFNCIKPLARGLWELKMGAYRVYFTKTTDYKNILLCAGDKNSQSRDIPCAANLLENFKDQL